MTRQRDDEFRLEEIGRALRDWLIGMGLLRLHLAVFALGAVGLLLLNLVRSPDELWAADTLRIWAIILACHAAALLSGWATWRAVRPHRLPAGSITLEPGHQAAAVAGTNAARPGSWAANGLAGHRPAPGVPGPVATNGQPPALTTVPARGRFSPPPSQPPSVRFAGASRDTVDAATAKLRAVTAGGIVAGRSGWRRLAAATRAGVTAISARLGGEDESQTAGAPPFSPPAVYPHHHHPPEARAPVPPGWSAPSVGPAVPPGWEGVVQPPAPAAGPAAPPGWPVAGAAEPSAANYPPPPPGWTAVPAPPPASAPAAPPAASTTPAGGEAPVQPATEWTWMEAAAAAWLARRDSDEPPAGEGGPAAPPPPDGPPPGASRS